MKRRTKWLSVVLLLLVGLPGLLVGTAYLRARRALEEHRRECEAILALPLPGGRTRPAIFEPEEPGNSWEHEVGLRKEGSTGIPIRGSLRAGNMLMVPVDPDADNPFETKDPEVVARFFATACQALRRTDAVPARRPGRYEGLEDTSDSLVTRARAAHAEGKDSTALQALLAAMGLSQDVARFGDFEHFADLGSVERRATQVARETLGAHSLSTAELGTAARWVERLLEARPTLASVLRTESALSRLDILEDFENVEFATSSTINPEIVPTWRDLWTETLCKARRLATLRRAYQVLEEVERLPTWEREDEAKRRLGAIDLRVCQEWEYPDPSMFRREAASLLRLTLFRVALALAGYDSEQGAFPETLARLVPAYLPTVPPSPFTGQPLRYEKGRVWAEASGRRERERGDSALFKADEVDWTVRRR